MGEGILSDEMLALWIKLKTGFGTAVELLRALWRGPYWWLVPILVFLLPLACVFVLLQAVPIVAPFVYTAF